MARYSVISPYTKTGAMTFYMPSEFSTPAEFLAFLDANSFSANADVTLEIADGTVLSSPFILEGDYHYLTIKVEDGGTALVDADALPKYIPFPAAQSANTNQNVTPADNLLVVLTAAGQNPLVQGTVTVPGFTLVTTAPTVATEVQVDYENATLQFFSAGVNVTPINVQYKYYTISLPWFIYNRWLESAWLGRDTPRYGLRAIHGTFQRTGISKPITFISAAFKNDVYAGIDAVSFVGGVPKYLTLLDFDQGGLISGSNVSTNIMVTCPVSQALPVSFGGYFQFSGTLQNLISVEPYGVVDVQNTLGSFINLTGSVGNITIYTGTTAFDVVTPTFISSGASIGTEVNMYVRPGSGGDIANCSMTCSKTAYKVTSGKLKIQSNLKLKSNLSDFIGAVSILGEVFLDSEMEFIGAGFGVQQSVELLFNASLGSGGTTNLFYMQPNSSVTYPSLLNLTLGIGGSNLNKVAIGTLGSSKNTSVFYDTTSALWYMSSLQSSALSLGGTLSNGSNSRIKILSYDENSIDSYGFPLYITSADIVAGVNVGDLGARPADAFCNGIVQLDIAANLFYQSPSNLTLTTTLFPEGKAVVRKTGQGALVDIDAYLLGGGNYAYLTNTMEWRYSDSAYSQLWNNATHLAVIVGTNVVYIPYQQINLWATSGVVGADIEFDLGIRPGDVMRVTNTSGNTISGNLTMPTELITIPYSLIAGAFVVVTIGWDTTTNLRTMFVT